MNLFFFLPEQFTSKKYVKVNGIVQYQPVTITVDQSIITKVEAVLLLIRRFQHYDQNKYVNIHSSQLSSIIGNGYKNILNLMVSTGLLVVNKKFSTQMAFAKSYKLGDTILHNTPHLNHQLYESNQLLKNISTGCMKGIDTSESDIQYNKGCIKGINRRTEDKGSSLSLLRCHTTFDTTTINYIQNTLNYSHTLIPFIQPYLKYSAKCGRITTSINTLKKVDRIKGFADYTQIDFSTSHLQHLIKMIECNTTIDSEELRRFKLAVLESDFYNSLANGHPREKNKKYVCYWLAGCRKNWKGVQSLMKIYPSITAFIDQYNKGTRNILLNDLMKSESEFINGIILKHIAHNNPDRMMYSIHDAILCNRTDKDYMIDLIYKEGLKYFGFKPKFKIENMQPIEEAKPVVAKPLLKKKHESEYPFIHRYGNLNKDGIEEETIFYGSDNWETCAIENYDTSFRLYESEEAVYLRQLREYIALPVAQPEVKPVLEITADKTKTTMNNKFSPSHTLQQLVDVYGYNSFKVIAFAAEHSLRIPSSTNYSDFPNAGKIKGQSALRAPVVSWPDIDEMINKIGEAKLTEI